MNSASFWYRIIFSKIFASNDATTALVKPRCTSNHGNQKNTCSQPWWCKVHAENPTLKNSKTRAQWEVDGPLILGCNLCTRFEGAELGNWMAHDEGCVFLSPSAQKHSTQHGWQLISILCYWWLYIFWKYHSIWFHLIPFDWYVQRGSVRPDFMISEKSWHFFRRNLSGIDDYKWDLAGFCFHFTGWWLTYPCEKH